MPDFDFIDAAFGRPHRRVPIWIMRQAGRYMPEYRDLKKTYTFLDICRSPRLMADVSMQPIDRLDLDAAIIFSDILLPLEAMNLKVTYNGKGPELTPPVRTPGDIDRLTECSPGRDLQYVLSGIRELKKRLAGRLPLIGFSGSPFTLAYYAVEGRGSAADDEIKRFLYNHPKDAERFADRLADMTGLYLKTQIEAGADAVQVFDSRGGILSRDDYRRFSLPFLRKVFEICKTPGVPRILYLNNTAPYLDLLADIDCEVVSIDWRTDIETAMQRLDGKTVQGNLDPQLLLGPTSRVREEVDRLMQRVGHRSNFIFNLGHGIRPSTPVSTAQMLVDSVHGHTTDRRDRNKIDTKTPS